jgi:hypothetical protein
MYTAVEAQNVIGDGDEINICFNNCYTASAYVFSTTCLEET